MQKRKLTVLLSLLLTLACCALTFAADIAPPPGWGQPASLSTANGQGQVTFKHGGTDLTLPLNKIEIDTSSPDTFIVSLMYVDTKQENKLELTFVSMPKLGKDDPRLISGFVVTTKAHGFSKASDNKTKCDLAISNLTAQAVSGTLSCKNMTDMSAEQSAPDVTDIKFDGHIKAH